MTQEAPFHTVGRSSEQRGRIVAQGRKNTGASSSGEVQSIATFWPTIRRRRSCSSFPASSPVCAVSNSSFKWPIHLARFILTPSSVQTLEFLTFVPAREGPKAKLPPLGGPGRRASGVSADSDRSGDAEPAPYNAQSADPRFISPGLLPCSSSGACPASSETGTSRCRFR